MHYKLSKEIINLSESNRWESAKEEWEFRFAYMSEEFQTCLCGHYPIKEICVIKNSLNSNETEVGNCCVNKFLGIDYANKIFNSTKRIKQDKARSMSPESLDYLLLNNAITKFEFDLYLNIIRKRNLSPKQLDIKIKINQKLIDFTSYELNSSFNKINKVLKWAYDNPTFDTSFILSLKHSCTKNGRLSNKQKESLENIINKWKIR